MTYPIEFSWKMIHEEIFDVFCPDQKGLDHNAFMKLILPENIFDKLFFKNSIYDNKLLSAVYNAEAGGESAFENMGSMILRCKKPAGGAYVYDTHPIIKAFREQWEALLPFTKESAGAPNMEEEAKRIQLQHILIDFLDCIPEELTSIYNPLFLLHEQQKYSFVLAILSVIATALSKFTEQTSPLYDIILPLYKEKDEKSFYLLCHSQTKITWERLHVQVFTRLNCDEQLSNSTVFMPTIIPEKLREQLWNDNKYLGYVYLAKKGAKARFQKARDHIINQKTDTGEAYQWDKHPIIAIFRENWESLIPATKYTASQCETMDDPAVKDMQKVVDSLLDSIPGDDLSINKRLQSMTANHPYSMVLAVLSVIASTLFCFPMDKQKPEDGDENLRQIVLPSPPDLSASPRLTNAKKMLEDPTLTIADLKRLQSSIKETDLEYGQWCFLLYEKAVQLGDLRTADDFLRQSCSKGYPHGIQKYNEIEATKKHKKAISIFNIPDLEDPIKIKECCRCCEEILYISSYLPTSIKADASYILYNYSKKNPALTKETPEYYLALSHSYGHKDASKLWIEKQNNAIAPQPHRSNKKTVGICYCNADNVFSATFAETIPDSWGGTCVPFALDQVKAYIGSSVAKRFLLVNDNFSKNLHDLFQALQLVKDHKPSPAELHWEFFVRSDSETTHALVDTALSKIPDYEIPVYIINDNKIAAQQLLSQHPLFYPIRGLKLTKPENVEQRPLLHFVIVGNSPVTEWLVREAFWMMGFIYNAIRCKITVLAENGYDFDVSLKGRFPGMSCENTQIDDVELPEVKGEDCILDSYKLQDKIQAFMKETPYCYFAVAANSDEGNLTLATRIRESLIRAAIQSQDEKCIAQMPPVAFLCRDDQIAWLSKTMVIEQENFGYKWFNTRGLIPFGEVSNRYSFDSITGGTFADLAISIHYQYNQLFPAQVLNGTEEGQNARKDYYRRQYNQDSSHSTALGMPYRLFQFRDEWGWQISPAGWNILESSTFVSANQLENMAKRISDSETDIDEIAKWEHDRWIRWMLSRGWTANTPAEAVFAYHSGNKRQQLFACKMHPCICSYDAQKNLQKILKDGCGLDKDFYSYDLNNIKDTKKLINLEWIIRKDFDRER